MKILKALWFVLASAAILAGCSSAKKESDDSMASDEVATSDSINLGASSSGRGR